MPRESPPPDRGSAGQKRFLGLDQDGFEHLFGLVGDAVVVNLSLFAATLPLQLLLVVRPGLEAWPVWLAGLFTVAPATAAAFEAVGDWKDRTRDRPAWRTYWSAWWRSLVPAGLLGAAVVAVLAVLAADLLLALRFPASQIAVVPLAVVALLAVLTSVGALAAATVRPGRLVDHLRAQLWLVVRHPGLSLLTSVLLGSLSAACLAWPVAAPLVLPAVMLYAVRANVAHAVEAEVR